jgi:bifunctional DNA-binding transcriptional regulator/antitoxin component of YhaV-PrlF toxin-antitoxin module
MGLIVEVGVRPKNQVTLPDAVLRHMGARTGDRLLIESDPDEPDVLRVRAVRHSYAGLLAGLYGTADEALRDVRAEQESWGHT